MTDAELIDEYLSAKQTLEAQPTESEKSRLGLTVLVLIASRTVPLVTSRPRAVGSKSGSMLTEHS